MCETEKGITTFASLFRYLKGFLFFSLFIVVVQCSENISECDKRLKSLLPKERLNVDLSGCLYEREGGIYGKWMIDERGMPAYEYTFSHWADERGYYTTSSGFSNLHWHGTGNSRIKLMVYNTGTVEVMSLERGVKVFTAIVPEENRWGGGIGYINAENGKWTTIVDGTHEKVYRLFTMDGGIVTLRKNDIEITKRFFVPMNSSLPVVIEDVTIENRSGETKSFTYSEVWSITPQFRFPSIYGSLTSLAVREEWKKFAGEFYVETSYQPENCTLIMTFTHPAPPISSCEDVSQKDYCPPAIFLHATECDDIIDTSRYSGRGDGTYDMRLTKELKVQPNSKLVMRYIFGFAYYYDSSIEETLREGEGIDWNYNLSKLKDSSINIWLEGEEWITAEALWHSAMLTALVHFDYFFKEKVISQGSAYEFLQGGIGAPRDEVLSIIPMTFIEPDVAKENLRFIMKTTKPDGKIAYAVTGIGNLEGAFFHEVPSDLNLFLLWGLSEYVGTTGDRNFLNEKVKYYGGEEVSVEEYTLRSFDYLLNQIGTGANGLIKIRDGDWNDGILYMEPGLGKWRTEGESVFNSAMAVTVLPLLDRMLGRVSEINEFIEKQKEALLRIWSGRWLPRGVVNDRFLGVNRIFLEPQIFALISDILNNNDRKRLMKTVYEHLDAVSPIGAVILNPPYQNHFIYEEGSDVNGGIWNAMNGLLAWAYCENEPKLGMDFLKEISAFNRARVYPEIWYGIWSGPDSYNSSYNSREGETFIHILTAMTDFPILNSNYHASFLLALIRCLGIKTDGKSLIVSPSYIKEYVFQSKWLDVAVSKGEVYIRVRAVSKGKFTLKLLKPPSRVCDMSLSSGVEYAGEESGFLSFIADAGKLNEFSINVRCND